MRQCDGMAVRGDGHGIGGATDGRQWVGRRRALGAVVSFVFFVAVVSTVSFCPDRHVDLYLRDHLRPQKFTAIKQDS